MSSNHLVLANTGIWMDSDDSRDHVQARDMFGSPSIPLSAALINSLNLLILKLCINYVLSV